MTQSVNLAVLLRGISDRLMKLSKDESFDSEVSDGLKAVGLGMRPINLVTTPEELGYRAAAKVQVDREKVLKVVSECIRKMAEETAEPEKKAIIEEVARGVSRAITEVKPVPVPPTAATVPIKEEPVDMRKEEVEPSAEKTISRPLTKREKQLLVHFAKEMQKRAKGQPLDANLITALYGYMYEYKDGLARKATALLYRMKGVKRTKKGEKTVVRRNGQKGIWNNWLLRFISEAGTKYKNPLKLEEHHVALFSEKDPSKAIAKHVAAKNGENKSVGENAPVVSEYGEYQTLLRLAQRYYNVRKDNGAPTMKELAWGNTDRLTERRVLDLEEGGDDQMPMRSKGAALGGAFGNVLIQSVERTASFSANAISAAIVIMTGASLLERVACGFLRQTMNGSGGGLVISTIITAAAVITGVILKHRHTRRHINTAEETEGEKLQKLSSALFNGGNPPKLQSIAGLEPPKPVPNMLPDIFHGWIVKTQIASIPLLYWRGNLGGGIFGRLAQEHLKEHKPGDWTDFCFTASKGLFLDGSSYTVKPGEIHFSAQADGLLLLTGLYIASGIVRKMQSGFNYLAAKASPAVADGNAMGLLGTGPAAKFMFAAVGYILGTALDAGIGIKNQVAARAKKKAGMAAALVP